MDDDTLDELLNHLRRERVRLGASNVFLFGPEGDPFWAAWLPLKKAEVAILGDAVDQIDARGKLAARPFTGHDDRSRFSYGALAGPVELYFVIVMEWPGREAAEARLSDFRGHFEAWLAHAPARHKFWLS